MGAQNYPCDKIPSFGINIPTEDGYYWWKEDITSEPEIVSFYKEGLEAYFERCGDDRIFDADIDPDTGGNCFGLFGPKVKSMWD